MRRFISAAAALVMMFIFIPSFAIKASAAHNYAKGWDGNTEKSCLIDGADIFTDQQEKELNEAIRTYSEILSMNIMIYVAGFEEIRSDYDTEIFADDYYDEIYGEDTDGILFYMDFTGKSPAYDYISTSGAAVLKYQKYLDGILAGVHHYFPPSSVTDYSAYSEDIFNGVLYFLERFSSYNESFSKGSLGYCYDESSEKYFYYKGGQLYVTKSKPPALKLSTLAVALIIGSLVAVIVYFSTKVTYRFKSATNARVYVSSEGVERFGWQDQFIRSYQTRTRIESNSGGGGGSRSGGGGHSHSGGHGGAGRHR